MPAQGGRPARRDRAQGPMLHRDEAMLARVRVALRSDDVRQLEPWRRD
jgi:hypothetical protein